MVPIPRIDEFFTVASRQFPTRYGGGKGAPVVAVRRLAIAETHLRHTTTLTIIRRKLQRNPCGADIGGAVGNLHRSRGRLGIMTIIVN
ncbi:MAG: hypothetical protein BWY63_03400 [Chloroflexi bacterium ADurb.Bin360]|nr:MAG: hypothetical protein BWY63_03400 [Chloroflexi bacterium ADurb.Bin360]